LTGQKKLNPTLRLTLINQNPFSPPPPADNLNLSQPTNHNHHHHHHNNQPSSTHHPSTTAPQPNIRTTTTNTPRLPYQESESDSSSPKLRATPPAECRPAASFNQTSNISTISPPTPFNLSSPPPPHQRTIPSTTTNPSKHCQYFKHHSCFLKKKNPNLTRRITSSLVEWYPPLKITRELICFLVDYSCSQSYSGSPSSASTHTLTWKPPRSASFTRSIGSQTSNQRRSTL
jgi:hypothetical protein